MGKQWPTKKKEQGQRIGIFTVISSESRLGVVRAGHQKATGWGGDTMPAAEKKQPEYLKTFFSFSSNKWTGSVFLFDLAVCPLDWRESSHHQGKVYYASFD